MVSRRKSVASYSNRQAMVEPLERRQLMSAAAMLAAPDPLDAGFVTEALSTTIPRLKTTYHGTEVDIGGTADAALHIDTFTHTGHVTADLTIFFSGGATFIGSVTGAVANRHFTFTFTGSLSTGGTASGTITGKVTPSGKGISGAIVGETSGNNPINGTLSVTRK